MDGLDLRTVAQAVALVEFRRATGKFPPPADATTAASRARGAANGVGGTAVDNGGFQLVSPERVVPAGQRAFQQAWLAYLQTAAAPGARGAAAGMRVPDAAWAAFDAVAQGVFLDQDTRSEKFGPGAK